VRKSMTKDLDMRYQSARDLLIDLKNLRRETRYSGRAGAFHHTEPRSGDQQDQG